MLLKSRHRSLHPSGFSMIEVLVALLLISVGVLGMIAMQGSISFIRPGTGTKLRAVAKQLSRGRSTGVFSVDVFNDSGKLVAHATINGFATGEPLLKE